MASLFPPVDIRELMMRKDEEIQRMATFNTSASLQAAMNQSAALSGFSGGAGAASDGLIRQSHADSLASHFREIRKKAAKIKEDEPLITTLRKDFEQWVDGIG